MVTLVAGGVLELHVGEALRHLDGRVHESERGREDEAGSLAGKPRDGPLRVRALRDALDVHGLDPVADAPPRWLAGPDVVLVGPTVVPDRSDVDEADLELVGAELPCRLPSASARPAANAKRLLIGQFSRTVEDARSAQRMARRPARAADGARGRIRRPPAGAGANSRADQRRVCGIPPLAGARRSSGSRFPASGGQSESGAFARPVSPRPSRSPPIRAVCFSIATRRRSRRV